MNEYEIKALKEVQAWQKQMMMKPSYFNKLSKRWQDKINGIIPEKVHQAITAAIKQMFRVVLFGSELTTSDARAEGNLEMREAIVQEKITFYKHTGAAEGGITGAGGILLGLADFPLFMGIKMKLLFEIASTYGYKTSDYRERLFILYIFQLTFSSQQKRMEIFQKINDWAAYSKTLPEDINQFDWRVFQQEYRDYIDLAKMAQLVPVIGAPVGAVVNYQLIKKLGKMAMNAYRLRWQPTEVLSTSAH